MIAGEPEPKWSPDVVTGFGNLPDDILIKRPSDCAEDSHRWPAEVVCTVGACHWTCLQPRAENGLEYERKDVDMQRSGPCAASKPDYLAIRRFFSGY